jgi:histidyl-tRNA synthetase
LSKDDSKNNEDILSFFEQFNNELLKEWLKELRYIYKNLLSLNIDKNFLKINPSISRWLNYYTWLVFETFIKWALGMWSIASWGRYDNLCSNFSKNNFPWVGGSIWLSRLISVLKELNLLKDCNRSIVDVLVINMWEEFLSYNLSAIKTLRELSINTELYLDSSAKMKKQLKYADNKKIPFCIIIWENEIKKDIVLFKDLSNWEQKEIKLEDIKKYIKY